MTKSISEKFGNSLLTSLFHVLSDYSKHASRLETNTMRRISLLILMDIFSNMFYRLLALVVICVFKIHQYPHKTQ